MSLYDMTLPVVVVVVPGLVLVDPTAFPTPTSFFHFLTISLDKSATALWELVFNLLTVTPILVSCNV